VISYDIDGAKEVCIPEVTGILVQRNDIPHLVTSIVRLAQSPDLRKQWGETGRQKFAEIFKHETMTKQIREIYLNVLGTTVYKSSRK
jgi:glycosyltransferase involved in cell wall biosynthesis